MTKVLNLIIILLCNIYVLQSQSIMGKVVDENNSPIEYANVVLLQYKDSSFIKGTVTDEKGEFVFSIDANSKESLIKVTCINYKEVCMLLHKNPSFITIELKEDAVSLNEIVVKGKRPIIKRELDKLVFNVENSPISSGNNIMDLLRQTPLIKVTDNSIGIIGKSSVKIMLNGKISYLDSDDLVQYLKSLQSDDVASIEVITTPPAKYDAGGNGGLINIVTKKKADEGWNGSVGASYTQRTFAGISSNASVNYRSAKSYFSVKIRQNRNKGQVDEAYNIKQQYSEQSSITSRNDTYANIGSNMVFEHQITPSSTIGLVYDFNRGKNNIDINNDYLYYSNNQLDSILNTQSLQVGKTIVHTLNMYYDLKLDSLGKKLSVIANFMHHSPDKEVNFMTVNQQTGNEYIVKEPNNISYSIYTGEANLELPFPFFKLETGIKYSDISNKSDMRYYNKAGNDFVEDANRCNRFNYGERILAGYASASKSLNTYFALQAGLRYEHTYVKGVTPNSSTDDVRTDYGNFFPTIYLSYKPNASNDIHINYARRINRPYFRALNPFRWYTNPNNVDQGNPALRPSFADNIELGYVFQSNLSAIVYYQKENNAYGQILYVSEDNSTFSTYENIYNNQQIGANLSYSFNLFDWWNIYLAGNYIYNKSDIKLDEYKAQNGSSFDYKCNNTISLDNDKRFQIYINYSQNLPYRVGTTYDKSYANCNVGLKYAFLNNNLVLNIYANDIFKQDIVKREKIAKTNRQTYHNYYDSRYLRLSIVYKWGNKKMKYQKKNILFKEQNRI